LNNECADHSNGVRPPPNDSRVDPQWAQANSRNIAGEQADKPNGEHAEMPSNKQVVYVVDDEKLIADTLATILNRADFIAIAFEDPCQALASARGAAPDFLISDVMMPGMTGVELGVQFREISRRCRVLLFSGRAAIGDVTEIVKTRGLDCEMLSKPMHPTELLAKLHTPLEKDGLRLLESRTAPEA
jgi:FixJ family two-component response regulator